MNYIRIFGSSKTIIEVPFDRVLLQYQCSSEDSGDNPVFSKFVIDELIADGHGYHRVVNGDGKVLTVSHFEATCKAELEIKLAISNAIWDSDNDHQAVKADDAVVENVKLRSELQQLKAQHHALLTALGLIQEQAKANAMKLSLDERKECYEEGTMAT